MTASLLPNGQESKLILEFPDVGAARVSQGNDETCFVEFESKQHQIHFHEYDRIYSIPGLYERLFYEKLKCSSPDVVCSLLRWQLKKTNTPLSRLRVLDMAAGNGIVGAKLKSLGVETVVGMDIIPEAYEAAQRDRPQAYDAYFVEDVTDLSMAAQTRLNQFGLDCMVTVASLGFGDMPPLAFAEAVNLIRTPGWVAFNIKETFLKPQEDTSGFSRFIRQLVQSDTLRISHSARYRHRLCLDGTPLYYAAIVARKLRDVPLELMEFAGQEYHRAAQVA